MIFQRTNIGSAYVVECYFTVGSEKSPTWHPLRVFLSQGDAYEFMTYDCPQFDMQILEKLAKSYDKKSIYKRINAQKRVKIHTNIEK